MRPLHSVLVHISGVKGNHEIATSAMERAALDASINHLVIVSDDNSVASNSLTSWARKRRMFVTRVPEGCSPGQSIEEAQNFGPQSIFLYPGYDRGFAVAAKDKHIPEIVEWVDGEWQQVQIDYFAT